MKQNFNRKRTITPLPHLSCLEDLAYEILRFVPTHLQPQANKIRIIVENYASVETLKNLNISDKYELLGLYRGVPMPSKRSYKTNNLPDIIFLYRCPIVRYSHEHQQSMEKLLRKILFHELSHHFGSNKFI